jgi:[acyl-carrier-protein] S-malonyltransferase
MQSFGIVFPGQGSQSVGMLQDLAAVYPEIQETFREASDVLGYDLWKLVQEGPAEKLDQTVYTQPALLTASFAIYKILQKNGITPALMAGHSLGEYSALVAAGSLKFQDAVKLVAARGEYMQEATPAGVGALAVIVGLEDDKVYQLCKDIAKTDEVLSPANLNSPGQIVIAGHYDAVARALVAAKDAGAKLAKMLPVSVPSHCHLMKPAAEKLKALLNTIKIEKPNYTILNNVDVKVYVSDDAIQDGLYRQLFMPVRWIEIIQTFKKEGVTHIIECGPGKVLTGLNKRIAPTLQFMQTADVSGLQAIISGV